MLTWMRQHIANSLGRTTAWQGFNFYVGNMANSRPVGTGAFKLAQRPHVANAGIFSPGKAGAGYNLYSTPAQQGFFG